MRSRYTVLSERPAAHYVCERLDIETLKIIGTFADVGRADAYAEFLDGRKLLPAPAPAPLASVIYDEVRQKEEEESSDEVMVPLSDKIMELLPQLMEQHAHLGGPRIADFCDALGATDWDVRAAFMSLLNDKRAIVYRGWGHGSPWRILPLGFDVSSVGLPEVDEPSEFEEEPEEIASEAIEILPPLNDEEEETDDLSARERKVWETLVAAPRLGNGDVEMSARQIAQLAGVGLGEVTEITRHLRHKGRLIVMFKGVGGASPQPSIYRLIDE